MKSALPLDIDGRSCGRRDGRHRTARPPFRAVHEGLWRGLAGPGRGGPGGEPNCAAGCCRIAVVPSLLSARPHPTWGGVRVLRARSSRARHAVPAHQTDGDVMGRRPGAGRGHARALAVRVRLRDGYLLGRQAGTVLRLDYLRDSTGWLCGGHLTERPSNEFICPWHGAPPRSVTREARP